MKWEKPSQEILDIFEEVVPIGALIERRKMFGLPCAFIDNNMFIGVFKQTLFLRLSEEDRKEFLELPDAMRFEPMPVRNMKEYVVIPEALLYDNPSLISWIQRSVAYVSALPPKEKK